MMSPQQKEQQDEGEGHAKAETEVHPNVPLPSKQDRLIVYQRLESVVNTKIRALMKLPDTRPRDWRGRIVTTIPEPSTVGTRGRQIYFLRMELLPILSASLLLQVSDLHQTPLDRDVKPDDAMGCMTLLLSNILLLSKGTYDARLRNVVKTVCVEFMLDLYPDQDDSVDTDKAKALYVLTKQDEKSNKDIDEEVLIENTSSILPSTSIKIAKERFETLEKAIATDILQVLVEREARKAAKEAEEDADKSKQPLVNNRGQNIQKIAIRSLQIGTVSLFVAGLFAVTGGLAAPGLVAAISAFGIGAATIPAFATLTTTAALASMFGVVGGGLAAYKMKKRTDGLREFRVRKENYDSEKTGDAVKIRGLHATVCVSGWLSSKQDFQTPFGVQANDPPSEDLLELLQRFFAVHAPIKVQFCKDLLKSHKDEEEMLWSRVKEKYGVDPNHLVPLFAKEERKVLFDNEQQEKIQSLLNTSVLDKDHATSMEEIFESNRMLVQMEMMNAEMFAQMNAEMLEAMQDESDSVRILDESSCDITHNTDADEEDIEEFGGDKNDEEEAGMPDAIAAEQTQESVNDEACEKVEKTEKTNNSRPRWRRWGRGPAPKGEAEQESNVATPAANLDDTKAELIDSQRLLQKMESLNAAMLAEMDESFGKDSDDGSTGNDTKKDKRPRWRRWGAPATGKCETTGTPEGGATTLKDPTDTQQKTVPDREASVTSTETRPLWSRWKKNLSQSEVSLEGESTKTIEHERDANYVSEDHNPTSEAAEEAVRPNSSDIDMSDNDENHEGLSSKEHDADPPEEVSDQHTTGPDSAAHSGCELESLHDDESLKDEHAEGPETAEEDDETNPQEAEGSVGTPESADTSEKHVESILSEEKGPDTTRDSTSGQGPQIESQHEDHQATQDEAVAEKQECNEKLGTESHSEDVTPVDDVHAGDADESGLATSSVSSETEGNPSADDAVTSGKEQEKDESSQEVTMMMTTSSQSLESHATADTHGEGGENKDDDSDRSETTVKQAVELNHTSIVWDWEANYSGELYTVTWESAHLLRLCRVVEVLFFEISNQVSKEVMKQTLIGGLYTAVAIPSALTTATGIIDDPYQLISFRSEKAGIELAQCLLESDEHRPVSLVGFSFGARVIFSCILELARHQTIWEEQQKPKEKPNELDKGSGHRQRLSMMMRNKKKEEEFIEYRREPASIVEDVVLIGLPMVIDQREWITCRELVGGRVVNCYNNNDWILSYMVSMLFVHLHVRLMIKLTYLII